MFRKLFDKIAKKKEKKEKQEPVPVEVTVDDTNDIVRIRW